MLAEIADRRARTGLFVAMLAAAGALTACVNLPEGDTVCPGQGPNSDSWPYCGQADPGGPGPVDDPIDPSGPY